MTIVGHLYGVSALVLVSGPNINTFASSMNSEHIANRISRQQKELLISASASAPALFFVFFPCSRFMCSHELRIFVFVCRSFKSVNTQTENVSCSQLVTLQTAFIFVFNARTLTCTSCENVGFVRNENAHFALFVQLQPSCRTLDYKTRKEKGKIAH